MEHFGHPFGAKMAQERQQDLENIKHIRFIEPPHRPRQRGRQRSNQEGAQSAPRQLQKSMFQEFESILGTFKDFRAYS